MQTVQLDDSDKQKQPTISTPSLPAGKEHEPLGGSAELVTESSADIEVSQELENAGVEHISGTIELPPDVKKLGVTPVGTPQVQMQTVAVPQVTLPISDQKVVIGLHASVTSAIRWLAVWCMKRLKKAHVALKSVGKKIIRVRV